ncbi:MAG: hypothetical protein BWK76_16025 [Desulfobulbaceae bacterium A2]|nr:MAG: hypothetical protein BWK76_16025 [Desulfobulbaceae bacterium A2]
MRCSVVTPNYNGAAFLERTITSVLAQAGPEVELEYIVVDGGSSDGSLAIIDRYADGITQRIVEPDSGPANAINKGLRLASGDIISWLGADDVYFPGTLARVVAAAQHSPRAGMWFGRCPIIDGEDQEIRQGITHFKECFFPFSARFTFQCINYLSQPALFFSRPALDRALPLREDMVAAWDYDFLLRIWQSGPAQFVPGPPLAAFRWHQSSISGRHFHTQFREELEAVRRESGSWSPQSLIHSLVRWGIVGAYSLMAAQRRARLG